MSAESFACRSVFLVVALAVSQLGCVAGPKALEVSRIRYNEAIQKTRKEQMLLNLVRLQYREEPFFLDVGTIATQFVFRGSGDAGAAIQEGPTPNPLRFDVGAAIALEERPTITLTPLRGRDFANRLLAPLELDTIVLLTGSGWRVDRVLRLTVQNMNGLDNASAASGPTPQHPPEYREFARVCELWRELQKQGLLRLGREDHPTDLHVTIPVEQLNIKDLVDAATRGYHLRPTADGKHAVLSRTSPVLVWQIPPEAAATAAVQEAVELLGLAPGLPSYEIVLGRADRAVSSEPQGPRTRILLTTRSLMGTLFYLSQAIEVPDAHRKQGLVTSTMDPSGVPFDWANVTGDLLRIRTRRMAPKHSAVAIRHWDHWYYVDNADLTSKSTLALLGQLFALQAGSVPSKPPTLTLPVGG